MALKTEIWIQAFIRRQNIMGKPVVVLKRGATEAGAVFVVINCLDGRFRLAGPAPGPTFDDDGDRRFIDELTFPTTEEEITELLQRRKKYDPDLWILETDDRNTSAGLNIFPE